MLRLRTRGGLPCRAGGCGLTGCGGSSIRRALSRSVELRRSAPAVPPRPRRVVRPLRLRRSRHRMIAMKALPFSVSVLVAGGLVTFPGQAGRDRQRLQLHRRRAPRLDRLGQQLRPDRQPAPRCGHRRRQHVHNVPGFITSTANYAALKEPYFKITDAVNGQTVRQSKGDRLEPILRRGLVRPDVPQQAGLGEPGVAAYVWVKPSRTAPSSRTTRATASTGCATPPTPATRATATA